MSDIYIPQSLANADANVRLADSLSKLLNPDERAKIANDIKTYHSLNDAEAKKHAEALALINQHQTILDETKRISEQNKKDNDALEQKKAEFEKYCHDENKKMNEKWSDVNIAEKSANDLDAKAQAMISDVSIRENVLQKAKEAHEIEAQKISDKEMIAESTLKKAEEIKKQHTDLLESIKAKQAAIAAFNI